MRTPHITRIEARNFRSLANVEIPLGKLTALVGPNGSGKTNVLNVLRFLASTVQFDLSAAVREWGGIHSVRRRSSRPGSVFIKISGHVTKHANDNAPDEYMLKFWGEQESLKREEEFTFKRISGPGRRITVKDKQVVIGSEGTADASFLQRNLATAQITGLATLPQFADEEGGEGIRDIAELLSEIRVLEPDLQKARHPSRMHSGRLADDASNLSAALYDLHRDDSEAFDRLREEMRWCLPGLDDIKFENIGGPSRSVATVLLERGVASPIHLADASFGTVRLLALLTALHDPDPPAFTAIEEVDHGLHPYALDMLVDRLRAASERTQILATTHAPTLVNRLKPAELVVCDRDPETGASEIPCTDASQFAAAESSDLRRRELWFAGAVGGVL